MNGTGCIKRKNSNKGVWPDVFRNEKKANNYLKSKEDG
jgi:hypothetical protein